jgi:hypothetical protein
VTGDAVVGKIVGNEPLVFRGLAITTPAIDDLGIMMLPGRCFAVPGPFQQSGELPSKAILRTDIGAFPPS